MKWCFWCEKGCGKTVEFQFGKWIHLSNNKKKGVYICQTCGTEFYMINHGNKTQSSTKEFIEIKNEQIKAKKPERVCKQVVETEASTC